MCCTGAQRDSFAAAVVVLLYGHWSLGRSLNDKAVRMGKMEMKPFAGGGTHTTNRELPPTGGKLALTLTVVVF